MFFRPAAPVSARIAILGLCSLAVVCHSRTLVAAEWSLQPWIDFTAGYDDNPALATNDPVSSSTFTITPSLRVQRNTETTEMDLGVLLSRTNFSAEEFENLDEQVVNFSSAFQTSERNTWGLGIGYRRDQVFDTLVDISSVTDELPTDIDIGLVDVPVSRNTRRLEPSWTRQLSERNELRLGYAIEDVGFSNRPGTDLQDYTNQSLSVEFSRIISATNTIDVVANVSAFRSSTDSDTRGIAAGITHRFSERMSGRFLLGVQETEETTATQRGKSSGPVLFASLERRTEIGAFDGLVSDLVSPSGVGQSVRSREIRVRWRRDLSRRLQFLLIFDAFRNKVLEGNDPSVDRRYADFASELSWQVAPRWFINGAYRYRWQKFDAFPQSSNSNSLFFGMTYGLRRQAIAR